MKFDTTFRLFIKNYSTVKFNVAYLYSGHAQMYIFIQNEMLNTADFGYNW